MADEAQRTLGLACGQCRLCDALVSPRLGGPRPGDGTCRARGEIAWRRRILSRTCAKSGESCLSAPSEIPPVKIKRIREGAHVSQPVFARYLNTGESAVRKWEASTERPNGMALKLLAWSGSTGSLAPTRQS